MNQLATSSRIAALAVAAGLSVLAFAQEPDAPSAAILPAVDLPDDQLDRGAILNRLDTNSGRLRCEVAASINRKRVPTLVFNVLSSPTSQDNTSGQDR